MIQVEKAYEHLMSYKDELSEEVRIVHSIIIINLSTNATFPRIAPLASITDPF